MNPAQIYDALVSIDGLRLHTAVANRTNECRMIALILIGIGNGERGHGVGERLDRRPAAGRRQTVRVRGPAYARRACHN